MTIADLATVGPACPRCGSTQAMQTDPGVLVCIWCLRKYPATSTESELWGECPDSASLSLDLSTGTCVNPVTTAQGVDDHAR
jgi:hypothetical protein